LIGRRFNNRYEVREMIGEGATSAVYLAFDALLERDVALKVLLPHVKESTRVRFFQEATAAAQLNHPNIMAIYDRGEDAGTQYLVVEYVDGEPLTQYIPCTPREVVDIGTQIALALSYAHERNIIHRDIKPANIHVNRANMVKIMDLGLALPGEAQRVTAPGMVIGTPAYISPEQAQGHAIDHRTDIYSLGVVLYEMATGSLPFNADDIMALLMQHVQDTPTPPRALVPDLPVGLESVILKTLEKNPNRRIQTCLALAETLQAVEVVPQALRTGTSTRRPDWARTIQTDQLKLQQLVRVVVVDDHALFRRTLTSYLEHLNDYVVVGEASNAEEALICVTEQKPDLLILDLNLPGRSGLDVLPEIRVRAPEVKVLVLTGRDNDAYILRALRAGAHGYILKATDEDELMDAIYRVINDQIVLGRGVAEKVVGGLVDTSDGRQVLTANESRMLLLIAAGWNNQDIAHYMDFSLAQVIETLASVLNKLDVRDRNSAALKALRDGEILLEDLYTLPSMDHP
jgi:serine/threonine protein kinase/DNA-binding CsgD family transcriptional regulator